MQQDDSAKYINTQQGGISVFFKVLGFMITLVLVFTGITNLLPQVKGEAPKDIKVDLGALTMDSYISLGESLFKGKGTCTLCHNELGRAPNILALNMEETAMQRIASDGYKGEAKDSQHYFHESMISPSKYVVPGYGKAGDPSPMPTINKAPIALSEIEIGAIIAFLQAKDGGNPTVQLPTDAPAIVDQAKVEPPKPAKDAVEALTKYGCTACHSVLESKATIGPDLNTVGNRSSREEIRSSIIDPAAVITKGFPPIMPADFADKMMVKELEMIVDYLAKNNPSSELLDNKPEKNLPNTDKKGEK